MDGDKRPKTRPPISNSGKKVLSKTWEIHNPTNHTLKFLGGDNVTGIIPRVPSTLDRNFVFITISYQSTPSSGLTFPSDMNRSVERGTRTGIEVVNVTIPVNDIIESRNGIYVKELNLVIGTPAKDLLFPDTEKSNVRVHEECAAVHHHFIVISDRERIEGKVGQSVYVKILEGLVNVDVVETVSLVPGLYSTVIDSTGTSVVLLDLLPIYATTLDKLKALILGSDKKSHSHKFEQFDYANVNQFMASISKQANAEATRVNNEVEEEFKIRDMYRKDKMEEYKANRVERAEIDKQTTESLKSIYATVSLLAKVLG